MTAFGLQVKCLKSSSLQRHKTQSCDGFFPASSPSKSLSISLILGNVSFSPVGYVILLVFFFQIVFRTKPMGSWETSSLSLFD